jgi:Rieske Fe-S protein
MSGEPEETTPGTVGTPGMTNRRALFAGAGAVGAGALLAACGGGDTGGDGQGGDGDGEPVTPPRNGAGDGDDGDGDDGDGEDPALAAVGDVEVGGGLINAAEGVVVTQPVEGEFRGFSAFCTHQGCVVASVSDGTINCICHGSRYSIEDGSVVQSAPELTPETQNPLPEIGVTTEGDMIVRS